MEIHLYSLFQYIYNDLPILNLKILLIYVYDLYSEYLRQILGNRYHLNC